MSWQPIETAPPETRILLWCADEVRDDNDRMWIHPKGVVFGRISVYPGLAPRAYGEGMNGNWVFTHWMPIPKGPHE